MQAKWTETDGFLARAGKPSFVLQIENGCTEDLTYLVKMNDQRWYVGTLTDHEQYLDKGLSVEDAKAEAVRITMALLIDLSRVISQNLLGMPGGVNAGEGSDRCRL